MEAAIFGLIGTLVGGLLTTYVTVIKLKHETKLWRKQASLQSFQDTKKLKYEKYSSFLGACYYAQGTIEDMLDIFKQDTDDAETRLSECVSDESFTESISVMNEAKGWIAILHSNTKVMDQILKMEKAHNKLFSVASRVKNAGEDKLKIASRIKEELEQVLKHSDQVAELLRVDVTDK